MDNFLEMIEDYTHKPEDIFEIPLYINKLRKDYIFNIRQYVFCSTGETVLYAM